MKKIIVAIVVLAVLGAAAIGGAYVWADNYYRTGNQLNEDKTVIISKGSNLTKIAAALAENQIIEHKQVFVLLGKLNKKTNPKFGEYNFAAGISPSEILDKLENGDVVIRKFTIPEGRSSYDIMQIVQAAEGLVIDIETLPPEGLLLPETYQYSYGDKLSTKINEMQLNMEKTLAELWPKRNPAVPIKTPYEAIILASIVEKETGIAEERGLVASVFTNRLNRQMRLESDPTAIYGLTMGAPLGRPVLAADMRTKTPYNTYEIDGLPPTPICHPGRAAIEAVLNPPETNYLFFVANGQGGHTFGTNLKEHNKNIRDYRQALNARTNPSAQQNQAR